MDAKVCLILEMKKEKTKSEEKS